MAPEEESKSETSQPDAVGPKPVQRRDRRPGRGRRGRGRGGRPKPTAIEPEDAPRSDAAIPAEEAEPIFELAQDSAHVADSAPSVEPDIAEAPPEPLPPVSSSQPFQPASPGSVEKAIEEVSEIVENLRGALDNMEELLEMLELFERQKNADEREIDSLRRALRQMQRPRDSGHHPHR